MKSREKDLVRLKHLYEAIELIQEFSEGVSFDKFSENKMMQSAIIRQFEIMGEASANLSDELKDKNTHVEWDTIKDFRNLLIHEYFRIDVGEVWSAINHDVPIIKEQIEPIIKEVQRKI